MSEALTLLLLHHALYYTCLISTVIISFTQLFFVGHFQCPALLFTSFMTQWCTVWRRNTAKVDRADHWPSSVTSSTGIVYHVTSGSGQTTKKVLFWVELHNTICITKIRENPVSFTVTNKVRTQAGTVHV